MKNYLFAAAVSCLVIAGIGLTKEAHSDRSTSPIRMDDDGDDDDKPKDQFRLFRAVGEHKCQSKESIGHTCKVTYNRAVDCNDARATLKQQDCCPSSEYGGRSIEFKLLTCTMF